MREVRAQMIATGTAVIPSCTRPRPFHPVRRMGSAFFLARSSVCFCSRLSLPCRGLCDTGFKSQTPKEDFSQQPQRTDRRTPPFVLPLRLLAFIPRSMPKPMQVMRKKRFHSKSCKLLATRCREPDSSRSA